MYKNILIFAVLAILLVSCGSRRTYQTQAPTEKFSTFELIEIPDFKSDIPNSPPELQWQLPNHLSKKLKSKNLFTGVSRSPLDISKGVLIVDGTVTDIQPPEWYKQIVKSVTIVIKVRFIDKAESLVIAESSFEGTSKLGLLGGMRVVADDKVIGEIVDYIKTNY